MSSGSSTNLKRAVASVTRSLQWLDACLALHRQPTTYRAPYLSPSAAAPAASHNVQNKKKRKQQQELQRQQALAAAAGTAAAPSPAASAASAAASTAASSESAPAATAASSSGSHSSSATEDKRDHKRLKTDPSAGSASAAPSAAGAAAAAAGSERAAPLLFAVVTGGGHLSERVRCAKEIAARCSDQKKAGAEAGSGIEGVVIAGLGSGETEETRNTILSACVTTLPSHVPRLVLAVGQPAQVPAAVQCIDSLHCLPPVVARRSRLVLCCGSGVARGRVRRRSVRRLISSLPHFFGVRFHF